MLGSLPIRSDSDTQGMKRVNVDVVALVLALSLFAAVLMIGTSVIVNVVSHKNPTPTLSENTSQVMTALFGGIIGILGSYVGARLRHGGKDDDGSGS